MDENIPGIEDIRQIAKLNLSDDCYKAYEMFIEPNIRSVIKNYLRNWQDVESVINRMVMIHKKIYKTDLQFISLSPDAIEKYNDQVDVDGFIKVKFGMSFKNKIDYLKNVGILRWHSYHLLDMLNKRRNKIHELGAIFTQQDLNIFSGAYSVVFYILTTLGNKATNPEINQQTRENTEKWARNLISIIEKTELE
ncbi:MAG: hypothetical protein HY222_02240 [Thaumarchaeota archaeon]|nr:hypothetical protein [Nitrososphaerota archaeon]MBI3641193.1 hypothetical protein [Nitrososphaerota archaeon]